MIDKLNAERQEIASMIEKGVEFKVGRWKFTIREPYGGALDLMSQCALEMYLDESKIQSDPLAESKVMATKNMKLCARFVAIALLDKRWKIKLFVRPMTQWLLWKLKPSTLLQAALLINSISNFGDFTNSIRLISAKRTSAPDRIEQGKPA